MKRTKYKRDIYLDSFSVLLVVIVGMSVKSKFDLIPMHYLKKQIPS